MKHLHSERLLRSRAERLLVGDLGRGRLDDLSLLLQLVKKLQVHIILHVTLLGLFH